MLSNRSLILQLTMESLFILLKLLVVEDLLSSSLHCQLHCLISDSSHFINSILFPIDYFLGFLDNPVSFSLEKVVNGILCLNTMSALHDTRWHCLSKLLKVSLRFVGLSPLLFRRRIC